MLKTRLAAVWFGLLVAASAGQMFADPPAGTGGGAAASQPDFLQVLLPGADNVPKVFNTVGIARLGDYLYAADAASWAPPAIHYLKQDPATGKLTYCGAVATLAKHVPVLCPAGGRLYVLLASYAQYSLAWYDIDPATGKPTESGKVDDLAKIAWAGSLIADAEGKNLYLWGDGKVLWFKIDADGKPVKAGEVTGRGIPHWGSKGLGLSPDGKHLYSIDGESYAIACIERKPDGSITYKKAFDLEAISKKNDQHKPAGTLSFSPDGKWLYAALWRGSGPAGCGLGVLRRDPDSGDLTVQEAGSGNDSSRPDFKLSNLRGLRLVFLPDGTGGYAETSSGALLQSFRCDPATGRLSDIVDITSIDARQFSTVSLLLDAKRSILYGTGENGTCRAIWAMAVPPKDQWLRGTRTDIQTVLVGTQSATGPAAEVDWPRWRGVNMDGKNPTKGIRKDWTGGLKKVWEVRGLDPGTNTASAPCVKGNKLVVMGRHGGVDELFCFDADKGGAPLWIAEFATGDGSDYGWGDGPQATPCIDGDQVFFASRFGDFACARMSDGKILWKKQIGTDNHGYGACPLVWDDLVILPCGDRQPLAAYKKDTGEKVWTCGEHPGGEGMLGYVSPIRAKLGDKQQVVFYAGKHLYGIDHATGQVLWDSPITPGGQYCAPIVEGNIVYVSPVAPQAVQIEGTKATSLWTSADKDPGHFWSGHSEGIALDGYLYTFVNKAFMGGVAGDFRCVDLKTGQTRWLQKDTGCGTMVAVDGCLLCLTHTGDLFLLDPKPDGFKKLAEWKGAVTRDKPWMHHGIVYFKTPAPCWTVPVVARGKLYLRYADQLVCYDLMADGK